MIVVTGATGQLGRLVLAELLKTVPAAELVAAVRNPEKAQDLAAQGIQIRHADYSQPATLDRAFAGANKVLLISSNELGQRFAQHQAVIAAAQRKNVQLLAYTSVLHADRSPLGLAAEHRQTEEALRASGLRFAVLRNGWYTENYTAGIPGVLAHGTQLGSAGEGRIASASRADYAAAAAMVMSGGNEHAGQIYELAGDDAYTLAQFAAEVAQQSGQPITYTDLPEADYQAALLAAGLPAPFAELLADSDAGAAQGALFDDSRQLSQLLRRPTTPLAVTIKAALAG